MITQLKVSTTCANCGKKIPEKMKMVQELRDITHRPYLYQSHIECHEKKGEK